MEPKGSLPCSQQPATAPCSEPDEYNSQIPTLFPKIYSIFILPSTPRSSEKSLPCHFINLQKILITFLFSLFTKIANECPRSIFSISASYSQGSGFEFQPWYQPFWQVFVFSSFPQGPPQNRSHLLPPKILQFIISNNPVIRRCINSEAQKEVLNNRRWINTSLMISTIRTIFGKPEMFTRTVLRTQHSSLVLHVFGTLCYCQEQRFEYASILLESAVD